jgi:very-short-patch-repair endonuclease
MGRIKNRKIIKCMICGNNFKVIKSSKRKYCSKNCSNKMNIGKKYSNERRKNISLALRGRPVSYEKAEKNRMNLLLASKAIGDIRRNKTYEEIYGAERAKEIKDKMKKNHVNPCPDKKGKTMEEYYGKEKANRIKKKISKKVIAKQNGALPDKCFKKGHVPWNKGKSYEEHFGKEELKKRMKKWRQLMDRKVVVPKKDSKPELLMQKILRKLNIDFIKHKPINIKHNYQCDLFVPKYNLIIEIDGIYWHNYPYGRKIDKIRTNELISAGYKVLRFWEGMFDDIVVYSKLKELTTK